MAWQLPSFKIPSFVADVDLKDHQFKAVQGADTEARCELADAGGHILGMLQNTPDEDFAAEIMVKGVSKAISGAGVTLHSQVQVGTEGRLIDATSGVVVGIALQSTTGADEVFSVLLV